MYERVILINALFWCILFGYAFHKDRSRYRNCLLLFIAINSLIPALSLLAGENSRQTLLAFVIIIVLAILVVPFFLVHNGLVMMQREG